MLSLTHRDWLHCCEPKAFGETGSRLSKIEYLEQTRAPAFVFKSHGTHEPTYLKVSIWSDGSHLFYYKRIQGDFSRFPNLQAKQ